MSARVGISGWTYPGWRGDFYPKGLPHRAELAYASERLTSIEVNGSFYSLQRPSSFQRWGEETPDDFVFSLKGGRFITHLKRLLDAETALANFLASGVLALGPKLGPLLWQLPPNFQYDEERLTTFFEALPRSTLEAAEIAARHDDRLKDDQVVTEALVAAPIRHAVEIRHASLASERMYALLRDQGIALVVADSAGRWPAVEQVTTDFMYVRLHGADELYVSGYTDEALDAWARKINAWTSQGLDVYTYFDNDAKVRAPYDAMALIERLTAA